MSDLIDRNALYHDMAMKRLELQKEGLSWSEFCRGFGFAMEFVKQTQSVEQVPKWIPVTKTLPWNDTDVLVTVLDDSGDTPFRYTAVGWRTPDGQYWVVNNEMCYGVLAWMPLPEPYRGGHE